MKKLFKFGVDLDEVISTVYDNGEGGDGSGDGGNGDLIVPDGGGDPTPPAKPPAPTPPPKPGNQPRTYTEDEYKKAIETEKKRAQEQTRDTIRSLEKLKELSSISEQEKVRLSTQIDELNRSLLSKEELAKREKEKLLTEHRTNVDNLTKDRDTWRNRFEETQIVRAITDAAIVGEAFNPKLIVPLLKPNAVLVEGTGPDGKPSGHFSVKIRLTETETNGEVKVMSFSPEEAIKVMKDKPVEYGQLFKGNANGGVGGSASPSKTAMDAQNIGATDYRAHRSQFTGKGQKK